MSQNVSHARLELVYPIEQVKQPIIYHLVSDYKLIPNIRRARIDAHTGGMMVLDVEGQEEDIARAVAYLSAMGITVTEVGSAESWDI
jgi:L-aspartate semialdehyde sulfurtransferase ferredoxin